MALVFIPLPPISISVRPLEHVPVLEMKSAPVRLSAQALTAPVGCVLATEVREPAMAAPSTKAMRIFPRVEGTSFMVLILPNFLESFLLEVPYKS